MSINEIKMNGVTLMSTRNDSVTESTLKKGETATDRTGRQIVGNMSETSKNAYKTDDTVGDISDNDYIPFQDVDDEAKPTKKTLWSTLVNKLKAVFVVKSNERYQTINGDLLSLKTIDIDASKADNNVSVTQYPTTLNVLDKEERIIVRSEAVVKPDGSIGFNSYIRNYDTDGTEVAQKGIQYQMNKSGNLTYQVDDSNAFKEAIDIKPSDIGNGYAQATVTYENNTVLISATIDGFKLKAGAMVSLYSTSEITVPCTLDVNETGAKGVKYWSDEDVSEGTRIFGSRIVLFIYDGTYYRILSQNRTPIVRTSGYEADTSGRIIVEWGYGTNNVLLDYNLENDKLNWSRKKNNAWFDAPVTLADYRDLITQYGIEIPSGADLNDYKTAGVYNVSSAVSNRPSSIFLGKLIVMNIISNSFKVQIFIPNNFSYSNPKPLLYMRYWNGNGGGSWDNWYKIMGETA